MNENNSAERKKRTERNNRINLNAFLSSSLFKSFFIVVKGSGRAAHG